MPGLAIPWSELPRMQRPCTLWLQGIPAGEQEVCSAVIGELYRASGWTSLPVLCPPDGFQSCSGFYAIITALRRISYEMDSLLHTYHDVLQELCPALLPSEEQATLTTSRTAEFIASGVTRRINRETHRLCHLIDQGACLLLEAVTMYAQPHGQMALLIAHYDWLDRPTLKILARAQLLARQQATLHLIGLGASQFHIPPETAGHSLEARICQGRAELFKRLQATLCPTVLLWPGGSTADEPAACVPFEMPETPAAHHIPGEVGQAISQLNFDRAMLLAEALGHSYEPETLVHKHRFLGIIEAQLGHYDQAFEEFSTAAALTREPYLLAHLHYLMGLVLTKRLYDFEKAEEYYQHGLTALKDADPEEPQTTIERAWLHNGLCLLDVLRTRLCPPAEQPDRLLAILMRQIALSTSLASIPSPGVLYLRYNLFANIATLLGTLGQEEQAVACWRETFAHHFSTPGNHADFDRRIHYHIGVLLLKVGHWHASLEHLQQALAASHRNPVRLDEERIRAALGMAYYQSQEYDLARQHFGAGARLAFSLRNWSALWEHICGALWADAHLQATEDFWAIVEQECHMPVSEPGADKLARLRQWSMADVGPASLGDLLRAAEIPLALQLTVLPASFASIDLESLPTVSTATLIAAPGIQRLSQPALSEA